MHTTPGRLPACTEADAVAATGGVAVEVEPGEPYAPGRPRVLGPSAAWDVLRSRLTAALPPTRVVSLPGALVVGRSGWVVVPAAGVVVPLSWYESDGRASLASVRWTQVRPYPGTLLNLSTTGGSTNYAHFLLDGLGRLAVAEAGGVHVGEVDWVLVGGFRSADADRAVARLGVPADRLLRTEPDVAVTADVVVTPSLPGTTRVYRPSLPRLMRRWVAGSPAVASPERVYVVRDAASRTLRNAAAVEALLGAAGAVPVHPERVAMAQVLAGASLVVGEHGAALAAAGYCRPGCRLVELLPSDHLQPYYYSLAVAAGLDYTAVIAESEQVRPAGSWGPSPYDVVVPLDRLEPALAAVDQW